MRYGLLWYNWMADKPLLSTGALNDYGGLNMLSVSGLKLMTGAVVREVFRCRRVESADVQQVVASIFGWQVTVCCGLLRVRFW